MLLMVILQLFLFDGTWRSIANGFIMTDGGRGRRRRRRQLLRHNILVEIPAQLSYINRV